MKEFKDVTKEEFNKFVTISDLKKQDCLIEIFPDFYLHSFAYSDKDRNLLATSTERQFFNSYKIKVDLNE
jgi:hypothetical protein